MRDLDNKFVLINEPPWSARQRLKMFRHLGAALADKWASPPWSSRKMSTSWTKLGLLTSGIVFVWAMPSVKEKQAAASLAASSGEPPKRGYSFTAAAAVAVVIY